MPLFLQKEVVQDWHHAALVEKVMKAPQEEEIRVFPLRKFRLQYRLIHLICVCRHPREISMTSLPHVSVGSRERTPVLAGLTPGGRLAGPRDRAMGQN